MPHLALALLGPFEVRLDGLPVEGLNSDRLRALVAYLAVERRREHPREQVASLLWPERPDREALSALRYALSNLHAALGDRRTPSPFLLGTRTTIEFNAASDHWLDVAEFLDLAGHQDLSGLTRAASLYRGPFLHGLSVADSPAFDDWMLLKDEEYRRGVLSVFGHLTSLRITRGEYDEAARWAQRQIELEPYREQAHRQLMAALALSGERFAALAHYETFRRLLAQELGCEPEDDTQALHAQIRAGSLPQPQSSPVIVSSPPPSAGCPFRFAARERELARLDTLLERALDGPPAPGQPAGPGGGMVLIAGEAGSGKTTLLDKWARQSSQARGDLIVLRGSCNAHGGAGDPYLPFREMLQTLAGDVEGKRAGGTLSPEQARRVWEALPAVGAALMEHGPDLIDTFVPGEALLRRAEAFPALPGVARALGHFSSGQGWQARLREIVRRPADGTKPAPQPDLFAQVTRVLHAVSMRRPLLLAVDDLQWADGGTTALLFHLGRRLAGSRILLACAYRPEALGAEEESQAAARGIGAVLHELTREWGDVLVDLDEVDGRAFIEAYIDSEPNRLGPSFRQALYDHTGGNPLFTVELLRSFEREGALLQDEAGRWVEAAEPDWERWPPQVEAVLAGHMASLPNEDRALLQTASVQGEQFAAEVAARVLGWSEEAVVRRLSGPLRTQHRLIEAVSLEWLASSRQSLSHYRFRHSLLQRGAYGGLDAVERARLHEATARSLEAIYAAEGERPQALAPALARHYEAAGLPLEAARQRLEAGRWAVQLVVYDVAIAHLERGLALLERAAASGERLRLELALWLAMVNPAVLRWGWRAPAVTRALERLSDLTHHPDLQDDPQRLAALCGLALLTAWSADPARGLQVGEQLLGLAQEGDRQSTMLAHWVLGHGHAWQGQFIAAREHLEQALALHNPEAACPLSPLLGADPSVIGRSLLGLILWLLGYPDQSRASLQQALTRAQSLAQPSSVALAHLLAGVVVSVLGRDMAAALSHSQALRPLARAGLEYGVWAELLAGQAQAHAARGQTGAREAKRALERGLAQVAQAESALQELGSGVGRTGQLLIQAQMCAWAGEVEMGLEAMDRAMAWIQRTGVRDVEAEVWRMRGELLLQADGPDGSARHVGSDATAAAEACFRRALKVAREQQARWLELRAAVSLARLLSTRPVASAEDLSGLSGRVEARELLTGIYGWFTEGFDTVDLAEAKALLEELD